jgi:hypothetical protein
MTTDTVTLQPSTVSDLEQSLPVALQKVNVRGVRVHALDPTRVRIETPVQKLGAYRFVSDHSHCSWTTSKGRIVVKFKTFSVEQRVENQYLYMDLFEGSVIRSLVFELLHGKRTQVRHIFVTRGLRALEALKSLDEKNLVEAVKAPSDYSVLVSALNTEEALATARDSDPLTSARLRGIEAKRKLLESEGGIVSSTKAAEILKLTRQAVDKRRKEGKLLGLELGKRGYLYPSWQFGLQGLGEVLSALEGQDFWEKVSFFLNPNDLLEDETPLAVLTKGQKTEDVIRAAKVYGEHGA